MKEKLVSIIVPNYNCDKYLKECLDSIYDQDYKNFELIIIDDGSSDESVKIIEGYKIKKNNIKFIKQCNMNASIARNRGIEIAKGSYLYFLDSDDIVEKDGLSRLVKNIESNNADLVIGDYYEIDDDYNKLLDVKCEKYGIFNNEDIMFTCTFSPVPSNKLYKSDLVKKNNIYFSNVNIAQDLSFFLKYLVCCNRISISNINTYKHRVVSNGMTKGINFKFFDITRMYGEVYNFYKTHDKVHLINKDFETAKFKHLFWQMNKQIKFKQYKEKRIIVDYFCYHIDKMDLFKMKNIDLIKRDLLIYRFNRLFKRFTCSKIYSYLFKILLKKKNIRF